MPEFEDRARLDVRFIRLVWFALGTAVLLGLVCLASIYVAARAVDTADLSRQRASERITQLQARIAQLEDRGLAPKGTK